MIGKLHIQKDWATVLAFIFGAAVIIPSIAALLVTLVAIVQI
jgi:hypothetical protein